MSTTALDPDLSPPTPTPLRPNSIPTVDLRLLSQSELNSLSTSSFHLLRCDDVVIPKIDRNVFNESAGSRKQTYSRLRLAPAPADSTTHRRAPRLRGSHTPNLPNDPEQPDNSQIVRLLKQLFKSDSNFDDFVTIEPETHGIAVPPELSNPQEPSALLNPKPPESVHTENPNLLNTELLVNTGGTKRKRGRPRKNEDVGVASSGVKRVRNSMVKKEVVYDEGKDREIVNGRGVEVDLVGLGRMEDPFGDEIRRRTEGLSTSEELLGFLRGVDGQWGTTRKKRRVVDASDFGGVLPKGWRLSLCIKKKDGRVWVFCRRYISPSGRQFESCKDISVYLLSILGEENMDEPNHTHSKDYDDSALKGSSGNAASLYDQEDLKRNSTIHNPSTPPISLPTDHEKQFTYGIVGPIDAPAADVFKCLKCFLIFEGKNDLLDHQSSSHKDEKSQHGSSMPDWSIVIGGIFECNICHKIFYEVNQYNGHVGTHVASENKPTEKTVDLPVSSSAEIDQKMSSVIESTIDEAVHDLDMNEDVLVEESGNKFVNDSIVTETDQVPDVSVSVSRSECDVDQDIVGRSNGQDSGSEKGKVVYSESSSGFFPDVSNGQDAVSETRVHTSSICEEKGFQENVNGMNISTSFDELRSEKGKVVNNESSSGVFHGGQDAVSETRDQTLSTCEEKGFRENVDDTHIFSPFGELTSEKGKVVNKGSSSGVFHNSVGLDEGRLAETKKLSESESLSLFPNTSKKQASFQKLGFASVDQVTNGFDENRFSYNISSSKLDGQYEARNSEFGRYEVKEHMNRGYFHVENNDKPGEGNLDEFQVFRNNQSINNEVVSLGGSSSQNGLNANVMDFNTGKNIEFCSLVPPGNNQAAFGGFQDGDKFDDIFGDKFDENIHELSLAFGNPNSLYEETVGVNEQKKDGLSCSSVVSSKINDTFDVQTDLSMVNNSMVQDLKRGNETRRFQNNDNSVYSGRTWADYKSDEFRSSEDKKFMMGSGSNQMWKTAQANHLQSGLVNSHAQIQSPNFHSFDIMSQKAQDGLFRHNERYNPSRAEPVEFRFLTDRSEHNPHALQPGSRVFPHNYNPGIEQGFDSTFWMGKNAVMPNMSDRNVITSVCAWCRNQFHLPAMAVHQQMQAGVGSLCPNCSAGISGQVNML